MRIRFISEEFENEIFMDDSWIDQEEMFEQEVDEDDPLALAIYQSMDD